MSLRSLTYMSMAVRRPSQDEIDHLLTRARARNEAEQVTGILLYDAGTFFQIIEGTHDSIERTYAVILADPLHHHIIELLDEEIEVRDFEGWSMAYKAVDGLVPTDEALSVKLAPAGDISPTRHLLAAFWNGGRGCL